MVVCIKHPSVRPLEPDEWRICDALTREKWRCRNGATHMTVPSQDYINPRALCFSHARAHVEGRLGAPITQDMIMRR